MAIYGTGKVLEPVPVAQKASTLPRLYRCIGVLRLASFLPFS